jgi:hypothetical protein
MARGGDMTERMTSRVSGNQIQRQSSLAHAQEKATEARNILVPRITSPISGNDITLRSMWSFQYRDINRAREEIKRESERVLAAVARNEARLAAQEELLRQLAESQGKSLDMAAFRQAATAGAREAMAEVEARIQITIAPDEPEDTTPTPAVITDGSDEPSVDSDVE